MAEPALHEAGHEEVFRLTAVSAEGIVETRYVLSAYEARGWRDRIRSIGGDVVTARAPADAFTPLDDDELDARAEPFPRP